LFYGIDNYFEWIQKSVPKDLVKIQENEILAVIFTLGIYYLIKLIFALFIYILLAVLVLILIFVGFYFLVRIISLLVIGSKLLLWSWKAEQYLSGKPVERITNSFVIEFSKFFSISLLGLLLEIAFSIASLFLISIPFLGLILAPLAYAHLIGWLHGYSAWLIYRSRPGIIQVELSHGQLAGIGSQMLLWNLLLPVTGAWISYTYACLGITAYAVGNQQLKNI
ncbi:MAG: hypothetical protein NZ108_07150, partial [Bacteroidia bacterium]|nr:hypothetical protein [Bacteroidia bacterium]